MTVLNEFTTYNYAHLHQKCVNVIEWLEQRSVAQQKQILEYVM